MSRRDTWRKLLDNPIVEWAIFGLGVLLLIISPLVGAIPGPGGIIVAGLGLAMILKTSMWAKRRYAKFKRSNFTILGHPIGHVADLALRRPSALRRERLRRERQRQQAVRGD